MWTGMQLHTPVCAGFGKMKVELSKDQCRNLAEFIDIHLLDAIRSDPDIDNLRWVESMILAKNALGKAVEEYENG